MNTGIYYMESLVGQNDYYFLDGYFRYTQVAVDPQDQEKTTFIFPFNTFSYRCMPFGLCNACHFPEMYDVDLLRHGGEIFGGIYG
jgi:hypothetical protein